MTAGNDDVLRSIKDEVQKLLEFDLPEEVRLGVKRIEAIAGNATEENEAMVVLRIYVDPNGVILSQQQEGHPVPTDVSGIYYGNYVKGFPGENLVGKNSNDLYEPYRRVSQNERF